MKDQCDSGQDALIVKVTTDAGIVGYGEVDSNPMAAKGCIEGPFSHTTATGLAHVADRRGPVPDRVPLAQDVPGEHLRRPARDRRPRDERHRPGPLGHQGQGARPAGLEAARRRVHASRCGPTPARSSARRPAETGERARRFADQGFTAVKFGWDPMGQDARTDVALVREARAGLGADARPDDRRRPGLRRQDRHPARPGVRAVSTRSGSRSRSCPTTTQGYAKLSAASPLRIAAGEEESERKSFLQLMDVGKIDVVQVDLTRCGGFTEAIKIAALAADRGLPVVNHGFTTYLNVAAALHFLASIPNTLGLLEFVVEEGTTLRHSISEPIRAVNGRVAVPDAPGLGIALNEEGMQRFRVA